MALPAGTQADTKFITVSIAIVLTTLSARLFFWLLDIQLGGPHAVAHPAMGGFLAGTGWLLITGGLGLAVDLSWSAELLEPSAQSHGSFGVPLARRR